MAATSLRKFLPEIYGTVLTTLENQEVSVLIVERVPHTLFSFCKALVCKKVTAETWLLFLNTFFRLIVQACGEGGYLLVDLHWKNLGITEQEELST